MHDRLRQAQFIATHYWELQGLRSVLVGGAFVAVFGPALLLAGATPSDVVAALSFGAFFLLVIPGMLWLDRYYARVFGQIQPSASTRRWATWGVPGVCIAVLAAELAFGVPRLGLLFLSWAAYHLWIVWRDWPQRRYHVVAAAAAALAAVVQLTGPSGENPKLMSGFFVVGAVMVVTGVRDHQLLAASLRPHRDDSGIARGLGHQV